jgi:hypothetical protein
MQVDVPDVPVPEPHRCFEQLAAATAEVAELVTERLQHLMQAGEPQCSLELHAAHTVDRQAARPRGGAGGSEHVRLADAGLAGQDEDATVVLGLVDELTHDQRLSLATYRRFGNHHVGSLLSSSSHHTRSPRDLRGSPSCHS